ncbi:SDR family NAD(P)-dependent oxidoreductase, partial [Enterobacter hormaechei]
MDLQLTGKTALVTGATAGIGLAIARTLAQEGVAVTLTGRDPAKLQKAASSITDATPDAQVSTVVVDLGTLE